MSDEQDPKAEDESVGEPEEQGGPPADADKAEGDADEAKDAADQAAKAEADDAAAKADDAAAKADDAAAKADDAEAKAENAADQAADAEDKAAQAEVAPATEAPAKAAEAKAEAAEAKATADQAEAQAAEAKAEAAASAAPAETVARAEGAEAAAAGAHAQAAGAEAQAAHADAGPAIVPEALGCLVEFETEDSLIEAAAKVRDAGYADWDAHTPYPVHGLDGAMGIKATILPWIVLVGGLSGCALGLALQLYTNGIVLPFSLADNALLDPFSPSGYAFVTSGKPVFSVQANIPVAFELTILLSAFGAFFGMWILNRLPRFHHPVFHSARFRRATQDRFFISIEASDALWDEERTVELARTLGGAHVEVLRGEGA